MLRFTRRFFLGLTTVLALQGYACAQTTPAAPDSATTASTSPVVADAEQPGWWTRAKNNVKKIYDQGDLTLALSGYAYHGRSTYTPERIAELNEKAWGLGMMNTLRDEKDNEELIYAMVISDSHFRPQPMAGYAKQWMHDIAGNWEIGGGYTASLISRTDYFGGIPFPIVLPVASIGTRANKLMFSYVPRLSANKGNGDVLLIFARFSLK
jgi:hypothetical protein